eukprot:176567_1
MTTFSFKSHVLQMLLFVTMCNAQVTRPGCVGNVDYNSAVSQCDATGLRLCTLFEITYLFAGRDVGCSFNKYHLWTSDSCDVDAHWIAITGNDDNIKPSEKPPECTSDTQTTGISSLYDTNSIAFIIQCCPREPTKAPTNQPTALPTSQQSHEPSHQP